MKHVKKLVVLLKGLLLAAIVLLSGGLLYLTYWSVVYSNGKTELYTDAEIIIKPFEDVEVKAPLRIMTYNIGFAYGSYQDTIGNQKAFSELQRHLDAIVQTVKDNQADILLLQEVDLRSTRTHKVNQLDYLLEQLHWKYAAQAVDWNKYVPVEGIGKIDKCVAILSKYPIVKHDMKLKTFKPRFANRIVNFIYYPFVWKSPVQYVQIAYNNTRLNIFNVHLSVFGRANRLEQLQDMITWITTSGLEENLIVGGDFNFHAKLVRGNYESKGDEAEKQQTQPFFQTLWHAIPGIQEVFIDEHSTSEQIHQQITFPELKKRYDFMFFSAEFEKQEGKIIKSLSSSDHLPVLVQLSIPPH